MCADSSVSPWTPSGGGGRCAVPNSGHLVSPFPLGRTYFPLIFISLRPSSPPDLYTNIAFSMMSFLISLLVIAIPTPHPTSQSLSSFPALFFIKNTYHHPVQFTFYFLFCWLPPFTRIRAPWFVSWPLEHIIDAQKIFAEWRRKGGIDRSNGRLARVGWKIETGQDKSMYKCLKTQSPWGHQWGQPRDSKALPSFSFPIASAGSSSSACQAYSRFSTPWPRAVLGLPSPHLNHTWTSSQPAPWISTYLPPMDFELDFGPDLSAKGNSNQSPKLNWSHLPCHQSEIIFLTNALNPRFFVSTASIWMSR